VMQINDDWAGGRQASSNAAAQTGIVSVAGIRLDSRKSVQPFKGIFCDDISETPNDEAMAKFAMTLSSFGNVRTTVMRAWDESEHLPLIRELS
jgi:hypothetical protein